VVQTPEIQAVPDKFSPLQFDASLHHPRNLSRLHNDSGWAESRCIFIEAQAGQGKSVLIAQLLQEQHHQPVFWYRMEKDDAAPSFFLSSLISGLEKTYPGFAAPQAQHFLADDSAAPETFLAALAQIIKELQPLITTPVTVVFDDVHLCEESPLSRALLLHLLDQAPARMQFILASRRNLQPLFAGINDRSRKVFLDNESLSLGHQEIAEIFNRFFQIPLTMAAVRHLSQMTSGWMMGLVLTRQILSAEPDPLRVEARLVDFAQEQGGSLAYFLQQVLATLSARDREILLILSLLDDIPLELASLLTGVGPEELGETLENLSRQNSFIRPLNPQGSGFVMHHLLQEGLRQLLRAEKSPAAYQALHDQAGAWYFAQGHFRLAVSCHITGGNYPAAQQLLRAVGPSMNLQTRLESLNQAIAALTDEVVAAHPWFAYARGMYLLNNHPDQALPWLEQARVGFCRDGDEVGELLSAQQIIFFCIAGDGSYLKGYPLVTRSMALYAAHGDKLAPATKAHAENIFLLANNFFFLNLRESDRYLSSGLNQARALGLVNLEAEARLARFFRFLLGGDYALCQSELEQILPFLDHPLVNQIVRNAIWMAQMNYLQMSGDFASYARHKERYYQTWGKEIVAGNVINPYLLLWDLDGYLAQGNRIALAETLATALAQTGLGAGLHFRSQYLLYQGLYLAEDGKDAAALEAITEALELRELHGGRLFQIKGWLAAGAVYSRLGQDEQAREFFTLALDSDSSFLTATALAYRCRHFLEREAWDLAHQDLRSLLGILQSKGYRHFLLWTPELLRTLLAEAVRMGIEPAWAGALAAERLGCTILPDGTLLPLLQITSLGDLRLEFSGSGAISSEELTESQRQLLGALLCSPDLALPQSHLQTLLWPESPEKKSRNSFDTLMSRLRKILQAALGDSGEAKHYLTLKNGIVSLHHCQCDTSLFLNSAKKGRAAFRAKEYRQAELRLHEALDRWRGEFLPTVAETLELAQQRHNYHLQGVDCALTLADTLEIIKAPQQALDVLARVVPLAPTNDRLARKRYGLFILLRQPSLAQNVLDQYAEALRQDDYSPEEIAENLELFWQD